MAHSQNQQPSVLGQKTDGLARRFGKEGNDRADKSRRKWSHFFRISFSPFPKPLPRAFKELVSAPTTAPIVTPVARTITVTVKPYFWKISLALLRRGRGPSLSSICACKRANFSFQSANLSRAASLSEGEASVSCKLASSSSSFSLFLEQRTGLLLCLFL